jgi:hypothetical protein
MLGEVLLKLPSDHSSKLGPGELVRAHCGTVGDGRSEHACVPAVAGILDVRQGRHRVTQFVRVNLEGHR